MSSEVETRNADEGSMKVADHLRIVEEGQPHPVMESTCSDPLAASTVAALRLELAAALKMVEAKQEILDAAGDGIYGIDADGMTTFANPAAELMTGWQRGELLGKPQHATIHHSYPDCRHYPRELCPIYLALSDGSVHHCDTEVFWRKDGTSFPVAYTTTPILREGTPIGATIIFRDISMRKRREAWEKSKNSIFLAINSNEELDTTLDMIAQAFVELFPACSIAIMLRESQRLRLVAHGGLPVALQQTLRTVDVAQRRFACAHAAASLMEVLHTRLPRAGEPASTLDPAELCGELQYPGLNACLSAPLLSASGEVLGVVSFLNVDEEHGDREAMASVTGVCDLVRLAMEHQHLHTELVHQSQHDHLTGLPNRMLLEDRLERAIIQAKRHDNQVVVCYVDLDHFKQINDTLGHSAGDSVLLQVSRLLKESLREIDTVARQGGDEFIIVLPEIRSDAEVDDIFERIAARLGQPMQIGKHTITVSASMGRCTYPMDGRNPSSLLQNADIALYSAKRGGRNRVQRFDPTLGEAVQRNIEIQRELRSALERKQFRLVYQPLFNMRSELQGFEALLRWDHPALGSVAPDKFIPLAEESGQIMSIGEWVLHEACRQAAEWNGDATRPIKIYVNVSGVQLGQPDFTRAVAQALTRSGLTPSLLDLEITETYIIGDTQSASARLRELRLLGVRISIDDFGCGHSTFSYLQQLPVDSIKIDRSFVSCLDGTDKKSAIFRTIVALAAELGLQTVAEGVETGKQFDELQATQCDMVQGFLLSQPLSPADASILLTSHQTQDGQPLPDSSTSHLAPCSLSMR